MTAVRDPRLFAALKRTNSATATLARHVHVSNLELDRLWKDHHHRLTDRERDLLKPHPGVFFGHSRNGFLRTPRPSWRPVAWVQATVLTSALPEDLAVRVLAGREALGPMLVAAGGIRRSLAVRYENRADHSGEPIFLVSESLFVLDGKPVALAREEVYEWVAH